MLQHTPGKWLISEHQKQTFFQIAISPLSLVNATDRGDLAKKK